MTHAHAPTRAVLLSIGDELLLGEIVDTNMPFIARHLRELGILVIGTETVGDELPDIRAVFERAIARGDLVVATGGLGPTEDDLTLAALAAALGVELEFRSEVLDQMAERLKRSVSSFSASNRKQACLPKGAEILRNDWGTAPGVHCRAAGGQHIFLMPGVPREMEGLLRERILPYLRTQVPSGQAVVLKILHAFGIPESIVGERLHARMQAGQNPDVGTRVGGGIVTVRLVAHGPTLESAQAVLAPALEQVRAALQEGLFGEDEQTLAGATLAALKSAGKTVAIAESCTAGLVAARLAEAPGASAALLEGAVVYSNAAKIRTCGVKPETLSVHGAVSAQTAGELALGIRLRAKADLGVSVTGIAGPDGGTPSKPVGLVYFGVATEKGVQTLERHYPGLARNTLRDRVAMQALDLLRRAALEENQL